LEHFWRDNHRLISKEKYEEEKKHLKEVALAFLFLFILLWWV